MFGFKMLERERERESRRDRARARAREREVEREDVLLHLPKNLCLEKNSKNKELK